MECNNIKKLLDKYWEGESSIAEEQELKRYFNSNEVAEEFKEFQPLFVYLEQEKKLTSKQDFSNLQKISITENPVLKIQSSRFRTQTFILKWVAVAASILLVVIVGINHYKQPVLVENEDPKLIADTYKNPDQAYQEAKAALLLISKTLNKGMEKGKEGIVKAKKH